jgi:hypothetical protein
MGTDFPNLKGDIDFLAGACPYRTFPRCTLRYDHSFCNLKKLLLRRRAHQPPLDRIARRTRGGVGIGEGNPNRQARDGNDADEGDDDNDLAHRRQGQAAQPRTRVPILVRAPSTFIPETR